jgi:two-component system response regulator
MNESLHHQRRTIHVLMVEDNADHAFLTEEAFREANVNVQLHSVDNGEMCLNFLQRVAPWTDAPHIDMVLMDINMPRMNGGEALRLIRADPTLRNLPVVMFTTSASPEDINLMYDLGCSSYMVKPGNFDAQVDALKSFCDYWFGLAKIPGIRS